MLAKVKHAVAASCHAHADAQWLAHAHANVHGRFQRHGAAGFLCIIFRSCTTDMLRISILDFPGVFCTEREVPVAKSAALVLVLVLLFVSTTSVGARDSGTGSERERETTKHGMKVAGGKAERRLARKRTDMNVFALRCLSYDQTADHQTMPSLSARLACRGYYDLWPTA